jgi:uncharacterized protein (DUF302 family)
MAAGVNEMGEAVPLSPVTYAGFGNASKVFQHSRTISLPHADVVERIERAVDAQAFVRRGGYPLQGTVQILAFHPKFMVRLLEADPGALLGAPLKFAVVETPDCNVTVSWTDHAAAFACYDNQVLADLGQELAVLCDAIATQALQ